MSKSYTKKDRERRSSARDSIQISKLQKPTDSTVVQRPTSELRRSSERSNNQSSKLQRTRDSNVVQNTGGPANSNIGPKDALDVAIRRRSILNDGSEKLRPSFDRSLVRQNLLVGDTRFEIRPPECISGPNIFGRVLGPTVDEPILLGLETFLKMCDECPEQLVERTAVVEVQEPILKPEPESLEQFFEESEPEEVSLSNSKLSQRAHNGSFDGTETEEDFDKNRKSLSILEESEPEPEIEVEELMVKSEPELEAALELEPELEPESDPEPEVAASNVESESQTMTPLVESTEFQTEEPIIEEDFPPLVEEPLEPQEKEEGQEDEEKEELQEEENEEPQIEAEVIQESPEEESKNETYSCKCKPFQPSKNYCRCDKIVIKESICSCSVCMGSDTPSIDLSCQCNTFDSKGQYSTNTTRDIDSCECSVALNNRKKPNSRRNSFKSSSNSKRRVLSPRTLENSQVTGLSNYTSKELVRDGCLCSTSASSTPSLDDSEKFAQGDCELQEIRYAITKICKFNEYTTFEVMKSTRKTPKVMPKTLEGVFVLRNRKINNCQ